MIDPLDFANPSTAPARTRSILAFSPLLLSLLVITLASAAYTLLFNGAAFPPLVGTPVVETYQFSPLPDSPPAGRLDPLVEAAHRSRFFVALFASAVAIAAGLALSVYICASAAHPAISATRRVALIVTALLTLALFVAASLAFPRSHSQLTVEIYRHTLGADPITGSGDAFLNLKFAVQSVAVWLSLFFAFSASLLCHRILLFKQLTPRQLRVLSFLLNALLFTATAVLISQILVSAALEEWMASYFPEPARYAPLKEGVLLGIGIFSSALLCAFYLPARSLYRLRTFHIATLSGGGDDPESVASWLGKHRLRTPVYVQVTRIAALLAPTIAGGAFEFIRHLPGA